MIQASHPTLHRLMQSLGQDGWPLRLWVYLMPFSLLWVSRDLPFPFVTSKALLITLWALMGLAVMMLHRSSIRVTRFDLLLLISILLGLLTGFANGNLSLSFYSTLERCNGVVLQLMLFIYLFLLRNTKIDWRVYWSVIVLVSSIVWVELLIRNGPHLEFEVASLLGNEAYLAGFLMLSALASGWLGARMPNGWVRWLLYCLAGVQVAIAVLTHNRSAITSVLLAMALVYSVNFVRKSFRRQLWVVTAMVLGALLLLAVLFLQSGDFHEFAVETEGSGWDSYFRTGTISTRLDLWLAASRMFFEAPIVGAGLGNFLFVFNRHHPGLYARNPGEEWVDNAHSLPFEMLATTGLVGTLPWIIMLVVLFVAAFRRLRDHPTDRWLFVALLACFIEQLFVINSIPKHVVQVGLMAYFTQNLSPVSWPSRWASRCPKGVWVACRGGVVALCLLGVWHLALAPYHSFRLFNEIRFDTAASNVKKGKVEAYFSKPQIYTLWPKLLLVSDLEQAAQNGHPPFSKAYVATLISLMRKEVVKDPGNIKARVALGRLYLMSDLCVSSSYKWLLATHGTAPCYLSEKAEECTRATSFGWRNLAVWPSQGAERVAEVKEHPMPQKLEAGNPAMVVILFLEQALDLILETGIERIENHARDLSNEVSQGLAALDINVITPAARSRRSGNTCFLLEDAPKLVDRLAEHQVYVWGEYGRVRVSGHLYNGSADIERLCDALKEIL